MNILFINNGPVANDDLRGVIKGNKKIFSPKVKNGIAFVAPNILLKNMLKGFGTDEKRFPLGLGSLATILSKAGHNVDLVDRYALPGEKIGSLSKYDFIGVYASTPCYDDALAVLEYIRKSGFKGKIAVGGPHATVYPNTIPDYVDYVVQGEGEYVINDLVKGVYDSGVILKTQRIENLDELPMVDYDIYLKKERPYHLNFAFSDVSPVFNMNTSRSCPFHCSFCGVQKIWGKLWTAQSAERVVEEIVYLKQKYGIRGVYFREDFFLVNKKRVYDICELLIKKQVNVKWACETRVDKMDEDIISLMAKSGCIGFYVGAESGSQKMLNYYNKQIKAEDIVNTCQIAHKYKISIAMSLIIANPIESIKDKYDTWRVVNKSRPEMLYTNIYRDGEELFGVGEYPIYPDRKVVEVSYSNGTWRGQKDRL